MKKSICTLTISLVLCLFVGMSVIADDEVECGCVNGVPSVSGSDVGCTHENCFCGEDCQCPECESTWEVNPMPLGEITPGVVTGVDSDGNTVSITISEVAEFDDVILVDTTLGDLLKTAEKFGDFTSVLWRGSADVTPSADWNKKPVDVRIPVSTVNADGSYGVLHYANGAWEWLNPKKVETGFLTVTFKSFSPIIVVEYVGTVTVEDSDSTPSIGTVITGNADGVDSDGNTVSVTVTAVKENDVKVVNTAVNAIFQTANNATSKNLNSVTSLGAVDVEKPAAWNGKPIDVRLAVSNVKAGGSYAVLHYTNGAWEWLETKKVEDGFITVTFKSFSPVIVVGYTEKDDDDSNNGDTNTSANSLVSPKTGETIPVAGIFAVICLAGACIFARKMKFVK